MRSLGRSYGKSDRKCYPRSQADHARTVRIRAVLREHAFLNRNNLEAEITKRFGQRNIERVMRQYELLRKQGNLRMINIVYQAAIPYRLSDFFTTDLASGRYNFLRSRKYHAMRGAVSCMKKPAEGKENEWYAKMKGILIVAGFTVTEAEIMVTAHKARNGRI